MIEALGLRDLALFSFTVLVLNATPGVDMLYVVGRTLGGGARLGLAAALGVAAGCGVHTVAAAFGLAALLAVSTWAFAALKWVGAAYLAWLALGMLRTAWRGQAPSGPAQAAEARPTFGASFRQGLLTNVLNPKVALFVLAFLPQFIEPTSAHKTLAFLVLGAGLVLQGLVFLVLLVGLSARLRRLGGSARTTRALHGLGGLLFGGLAWRLATGEMR